MKGSFENELYAIIVYGIVPEFMPHGALRRDKHYKKSDMKVIKCPYCRDMLTEVELSSKVELFCYPHKLKSEIKLHKSMPCGNCDGVVGIIYAA